MGFWRGYRGRSVTGFVGASGRRRMDLAGSKVYRGPERQKRKIAILTVSPQGGVSFEPTTMLYWLSFRQGVTKGDLFIFAWSIALGAAPAFEFTLTHTVVFQYRRLRNLRHQNNNHTNKNITTTTGRIG
ncbi:uncharacterized protein B0T15DRAFT_524792 [Chaetomium strumarium]|uniref:Uncharacterized protein n=1 Tax=Chaetomium strumarium TaxID=1170767 RepID=A0AAJ0GYP7_9PEZI|nr:hypothetical protein B0T15DRAFT_524792 [Chaetomium strumarium]